MLTKKEIAAIWKACGEFEGRPAAHNFGRMVRFLLASAQRRDDAASLRHGHILDCTWRQTTNKSDRPHSMNLPSLALKLVGQGTAQGMCLPAASARFLGSRNSAALDKASGVSDWRLHDLRRTAATNMQELGVPNHIVQAVLNHSIPGVGGVYLHAELEKQKAEALATWAVALAKIVRPVSLVAS